MRPLTRQCSGRARSPCLMAPVATRSLDSTRVLAKVSDAAKASHDCKVPGWAAGSAPLALRPGPVPGWQAASQRLLRATGAHSALRGRMVFGMLVSSVFWRLRLCCVTQGYNEWASAPSHRRNCRCRRLRPPDSADLKRSTAVSMLTHVRGQKRVSHDAPPSAKVGPL